MKNLKKLLFSILIISCFTFVVPILFTNIPTSSSYSVQAVKLNTSKKTLVAGSKYTLKVKGTSKKVKWSTSNKKVAKVSSKGKVTAVKKGTAYITAKVGSRKYVCKITVKSAPSLSCKSKSLIEGTTFTLKMKNTTKKVKWYTSNKKIAKVSSKGKVTAVKKVLLT